MDQGRRLILNAASNLTALGVSAVIAFLIAPYVLRHLGASTYGVWALIGSLLAYSGLLSLELNSAVSRWVSIYLVRNDVQGINRVVNTSLVAYLIGAGVFGAVIVVLAIRLPMWFRIPFELHSVSQIAVALVGAGFTAMIVLSAASAVLSGLQRYDIIAGCDVATDVARAIGIVVLFHMGYGLLALAAIAASSQVVRGLLKSVLALRKCEGLRIDPVAARWQAFREMLGYSTNTFMYSCGQLIQRQAALIVIGGVLGTTEVAEYALPLLLTGFVGQIVTRASATTKPTATQLDAQGRLDAVRRLYLLGTKCALLVVLPMMAFLLLFGRQVLQIWLADGFMETGPAIVSILAVGTAFRLWHVPGFFVVAGLGKHRLFGMITMATATASVLLGLILTLGCGMGVIGVAIGFAAPDVLIGVFLMTPYCCRTVGVSLRTELTACLTPAVLATLPLVLTLSGIRSWYLPSSLLALLGLACASIVLTVAGWWWLGFTKDEKQRFIRLLPLDRIFPRRP